MSMPNAWNGKVESISQEGLGVGTIKTLEEGKMLRRPVFIPFTVPGDEIDAEITEQKRKYSFAAIKSIINPSPARVIPPCPHFTVCGGCNLQHVEYNEQLKQKAAQIQFLLTRKNVALPYDVKVLPAKLRHNYRWRARIAVQFTGGKVVAGFRKFHSHDIIPVKTCFIVAPEIVNLITLLNKGESRLGSSGKLEQEIVVVVGESKKLGILVQLDEVPQSLRKQLKDFFEELYARNRRLIANLFFEENRTTKSFGQVQEHITYKAGGLTFSFLPETFIQSNVPTNETLISTAIGYLQPQQSELIVDLYAGLGNVSLPMAKRCSFVVAVEGHEASVLLGRINAYQNGIENTLFLHRSTEKYLYEYIKTMRSGKETEEYRKADAIILDPPRTGCTPDVLKSLLYSGVRKILYISCNPVTLANDLSKLSERYVVKEITGVDMFPDISHVETVVFLEAK